MNSWYIAGRLMNYEKGSFVRFILWLGYVCTALSMAVMIVSTAVISGFNKEITKKIFGLWGHVQVNSIHSSQLNASYPLVKDTIFSMAVDTMASVDFAQVFAFMPSIITVGEEMDGLILKGVDADFNWDFFKNNLVEGSIKEFRDTSTRNLIISQHLASRLKIKLGDKCRLNFVIEGEVIPRLFFIKGIYSTGLEEYDQKLALVHLAELRELNHWSQDQIGGYELYVKDLNKVEQVAEDIYENHLGEEMYVETIREKFPNIFDWLNLQNSNQFVILGLMLVVALINIVTVLLILILERTKMIGILKALGTNDLMLKKVFLLHGGYILLRGLIFGNLIGLTLCLLQKYGRFIKLREADYYLSYAPIHLNPLTLLFLNVGTISVVILLMWIPTSLISRISPIKAIGYR